MEEKGQKTEKGTQLNVSFHSSELQYLRGLNGFFGCGIS